MPKVNSEIHSFPVIWSKRFCFPVTQICAIGSWIKGKKLRDFSHTLSYLATPGSSNLAMAIGQLLFNPILDGVGDTPIMERGEAPPV